LLIEREPNTNQFRILPGALNDIRTVNSSLNAFIASRPQLVANVFIIPEELVFNEVVKFICREPDFQPKLTMALVSKTCLSIVRSTIVLPIGHPHSIRVKQHGQFIMSRVHHSCRNPTAVLFNLGHVVVVGNGHKFFNPVRNQSWKTCGFISSQENSIFLCRHHVNDEVMADVALHNFDARLSDSLVFWSTSSKGEGKLHLKYGCFGAFHKIPKTSIRSDLVGSSMKNYLNLCLSCSSLNVYSPYVSARVFH
jgi:hypothetical protein